MKNIIITLFLLSILSNCKAQEGIIEELNKSSLDILNGTYLKDLNNDMSNYTGTWKGTHNGNVIILKVEKLTKKKITFPNEDYYYTDKLIGRYTVYNGEPNSTNTTIIANSMNLENDFAPLFSIGDGRSNQFKLAYTDYQFCRANGELILQRNISNPNELTYVFHFFRTIKMDDECQYNGVIPIPLPEATITLTRVN